MDLSDKGMLAAAVGRLASTLGIMQDPDIRSAYLRGECPTLLSYEKLERSTLQLPVINRYILGVESYLAQPSLKNFYDIFRVGRIVPLTVALDRAIQILVERKVGGAQERFGKLIRETSFDAFEAILYEIAVAAKYASLDDATSTRFLEEGATKQPDIESIIGGRKYYVECKKPDRRNDASIAMRNAIAPKFQRTFRMLSKSGVSAIVEASFTSDPAIVDDVVLKDMVFESLESGTPILSPWGTIRTSPIAPRRLKDYALFPSPGYFSEHFGYDPDGEWQGLIPCVEGKWAAPSWLDDVRWESAVKWKISNDELLWKVKKLGYKLIFDGFDQLNQAGDNTVLHYWFERDRAVGHRKKELMHFFETLRERDKDRFGWLIFNEVSPSLSVLGRFDFIEHAHILSGPARKEAEPHVTNVFVSDESTADGLGEFGVGHILPPIDLDDETWKSKNKKK